MAIKCFLLFSVLNKSEIMTINLRNNGMAITCFVLFSFFF